MNQQPLSHQMYGSSSDICGKLDEIIPSTLKNLLLRGAQGKAAASDVQLRDDKETEIGESKVREALETRDDQTTRWVKNLKKEINKLTEEHSYVQRCLDDTLKHYWHFQDILRVSKMCIDYRKDLECGNPHDDVNELLYKEATIAQFAVDETFMIIKYLRSLLGKFELANKILRNDSKLKTFASNCVKSCQQVKPLLSKPYMPEEILKPYHEDTELEWEKAVHDRIMTDMALRLESRDYCALAADTVEKYTADLAAAWTRTDYALNEEINKDEHMLNYIHKSICRMDKEINASHLRMLIFHNEFERQVVQKDLEAWRMQRLNYRPQPENIRDKPVHSLEREMSEIQDRMDKIAVDYKSDQKLNNDMENLRSEQIRKMDIISKRLFAERENCRGLRRSVIIDGFKQAEN